MAHIIWTLRLLIYVFCSKLRDSASSKWHFIMLYPGSVVPLAMFLIFHVCQKVITIHSFFGSPCMVGALVSLLVATPVPASGCWLIYRHHLYPIWVNTTGKIHILAIYLWIFGLSCIPKGLHLLICWLFGSPLEGNGHLPLVRHNRTWVP